MEIKYFPHQQNVPEKYKKEALVQNQNLIKENNDDIESIESEETRYTIKDSCKK